MKTTFVVFLLTTFLNIFTFKNNYNYHDAENNYNYFQKINTNKIKFNYQVSNNNLWYIGFDNNLYIENLISKNTINTDIKDVSNIISLTNNGNNSWIYDQSNDNLEYISLINFATKINFKTIIKTNEFKTSDNGDTIWYFLDNKLTSISNDKFKINVFSNINNVSKFQIDSNSKNILYLDNNYFLHKYFFENKKMINYNISNISDFKSNTDNNSIIIYDINYSVYIIKNDQVKKTYNFLGTVFDINISNDGLIYTYDTINNFYKITYVNNNYQIKKFNITNIKKYSLNNENIWISNIVDRKNNIENLSVIDNLNNIHTISKNITINDQLETLDNNFFYIDDSNNMYEYNFSIMNLLGLNNQYLYQNKTFYFLNKQTIMTSKYISDLKINNKNINSNTEIDQKSTISFCLNKSLQKYNFIYNKYFDNKIISLSIDIKNQISYNTIKYLNDDVTYLGLGKNNYNESGSDITQSYLNNKNNLQISFDNLLLNKNLSYYQFGTLNNTQNFIPENNNKNYINNNNVTFNKLGIYKIVLTDDFGNLYTQYLELTKQNEVNKIWLDYGNIDFDNKLQKYNIKINLTNYNSNQDLNYQNIYNWLNLYQFYYNDNFQKSFNNILDKYNLSNNLKDKLNNNYYVWLNYFWNKISDYSITYTITNLNIDSLKNQIQPKINFSKISNDLNSSVNNYLSSYINNQIKSVSKIATLDNIILKNNYFNNNWNKINNYLNYLKNYNNYLNNNFNNIVKTNFSKLHYQNSELFNSIIHNRKAYINQIIWNDNLNQKEFNKNINNNKILIKIKNSQKNQNHKNNKLKIIIISSTSIAILLTTIILIIFYRNRLYWKNKISKSKKKIERIN